MKSLSLNTRKLETLIYCVLWAFVFAVPFFSENNNNRINWDKIAVDWSQTVCCLIVFLINVYFLVPKFLLRKKYVHYFAGVFAAILMVSVLVVFLNAEILQSAQEGLQAPAPGFPPQDFPPHRIKPFVAVLIENIILSVLIVGASTALTFVSQWLNEEKLRKDVEKEQLKTNLTLLRQQVSPHFFMNTLNNIHALIDIDTENAKDAIIRLSVLMRYLLYDSARSTIGIAKEIEFLRSFISLMKLRYSDEVLVSVIVPEQIPDIQIPPHLFISFLENAFKHGVSYKSKSFIYFELRILENQICGIIKNSKPETAPAPDSEYSGLGLENIKKSLALLYGEDYTLDISDTEKEFAVTLTLPVEIPGLSETKRTESK